MAAAGNGFMIAESCGRHLKANENINILPLQQGGRQVQKKYYLFWKKDNANYYIKKFAGMVLQAFKTPEGEENNL